MWFLAGPVILSFAAKGLLFFSSTSLLLLVGQRASPSSQPFFFVPFDSHSFGYWSLDCFHHLHATPNKAALNSRITNQQASATASPLLGPQRSLPCALERRRRPETRRLHKQDSSLTSPLCVPPTRYERPRPPPIWVPAKDELSRLRHQSGLPPSRSRGKRTVTATATAR